MLKGRRDLFGAIPGTFEAWLALRGLRTLPLRIERAQANAQELVRRLPRARRRDRGPLPRLRRRWWHRAADTAASPTSCSTPTKLWVYATSLGGVESTLERRRRWKCEPATIPDGLIRLSVGIEDVEDLWEDLEQALDSARPAGS